MQQGMNCLAQIVNQNNDTATEVCKVVIKKTARLTVSLIEK